MQPHFGKFVVSTSSLGMKSINIRECKFSKGSEGSIIYVEEENVANVKLNILSSNNGDDQTKYMIYSYCGETIFEHNKIEHTDKTKMSEYLSLHNQTEVVISSCSFTNCNIKTSSTIELFNQYENSNTQMNDFFNADNTKFTIQFKK